MEFLLTFLGYFIALIVGLVAFFVGLHKNRSEILHTMQKSINMLAKENRELIAEVVELRKENKELHREIGELNRKLENVKTITRTK